MGRKDPLAKKRLPAIKAKAAQKLKVEPREGTVAALKRLDTSPVETNVDYSKGGFAKDRPIGAPIDSRIQKALDGWL